MTKKVKGGIEKHYCDCCGKLVCDFIPDKIIKTKTANVTKTKQNVHCKHKFMCGGKVLCIDCYNKTK